MPSYFDASLFDVLRPWLDGVSPDEAPTRDWLGGLFARQAKGVPARHLVAPNETPLRRYLDQFEVRGHMRGEIVCRERNWHDSFNVLAWLAFPRAKAAITRAHYEAMEQQRMVSGRAREDDFVAAGARGPRRDALTLFDEGGVVVTSSDSALLEMIREKQWKPLFWRRRDEVRRSMRFFVLGHALHEKGLHPYKEMTARAMLLHVDDAFLQWEYPRQREAVDALAAGKILDASAVRSAADIPPLPLMGIPDWSDNEREDFYDDITVFRPKRQVPV